MDIRYKIGILLLIVIIAIVLKIIVTVILDIEVIRENSSRLMDIVNIVILNSKK